MAAYFLVVLPLALYIPMFIYETIIAFKRIGTSSPTDGAYVHATWEITHTFLVVAATNYFWLFSSIMGEIGNKIYWPLLLAGTFFIIRALLYLYLFTIKDSTKGKHTSPADWLFAISHLALLAALVVVIMLASTTMAGLDYTANNQFIPFMIPGLILTMAICSLPLFFIYKTK